MGAALVAAADDRQAAAVGAGQELGTTAAWPPVRMLVTDVPSTSASGMPVSVSVTRSNAEMAGRLRQGFLE